MIGPADWVWVAFIFAFGCCVGSFLNVVIYRVPRNKSIVKPLSACPACGEHIRCYDNIPLISWLLLGARCRYCKAPISPRYFIIELLTALVFIGLFYLYFYADICSGIGPFLWGGWYIYLLHIILLSALIVVSAIDLELWIIPISVCWFVTGAGLVGSTMGGYILHPAVIRCYALLPIASAGTGVLAAGAAVGLVISLILLSKGIIKRSYEVDYYLGNPDKQPVTENPENIVPEEKINHRLEVYKEVVFLLPIIVCSAAAYLIVSRISPVRLWWIGFLQHPAVAGLLGSLWGYFIGCTIVWATRIFGTLGFGKEAMGLGDVHLMGAAGAVIGPVFVVVAFFVAPFFGLAWAAVQFFIRKSRHIPYGPFLSLGILTVMIFHDRILYHLNAMFYR